MQGGGRTRLLARTYAHAHNGGRAQNEASEEAIQTIPTIGFNVETLQYKNIKFQVWDLGGQTSIRPYWRCYYPNTDAIVFVVDRRVRSIAAAANALPLTVHRLAARIRND